jgi:hypothetical protein
MGHELIGNVAMVVVPFDNTQMPLIYVAVAPAQALTAA